MTCPRPGRTSRFLRDDLQEHREVMPVLGEDMPVKRDVLFDEREVVPERRQGREK
jgi:hypothetical protein